MLRNLTAELIFGLTSFIRYIDKIIDTDKGIDSKSIVSGKDDAVTIMTVHHSKGLEFPICILAGAARNYNTGELTENLLINISYGFGLKVIMKKECIIFNLFRIL